MNKPKPFPPNLAAWLKVTPRASWPSHAAHSLHAHHPRWYQCRYDGSPAEAIEAAVRGFPDAWAQADACGAWLYLQQAREGEE